MSTPDDFESESGDVATVGGTNPKYYQVAVPNFPFGGTASTPAVGSSFVRLGSFPALTETFPGFTNSVTLAKLIGDSTKIAAEALAAETDGSLNKYTGDFLVGFADDTRYRKSADTSKSARQTETKNLLTKGGWWDHADGNRVTTTTGDKIEVIQGNYKMVVLGRQPPSSYDISNVFITDVSGGLFQEQNACPTPCIKTVEYTESGGIWTLFQDNGKGKVVTRFEGEQLDYFVGTKKEAYVGQNYDGKVSAADDLPDVISKTWAKKIETYTGADDKPVNAIHSYTFAKEIQNYTFAESHVNTTMGISSVSINGVLNTVEVVMGLKESFQLGATFTLKAAAELTIGLTKTRLYGVNDSVDLSRNVVAANNATATANEQKLAAIYNQITATKNELAAETTELATRVTTLDGQNVKLGVEYTALFGQINLV